jgi:membrane-bound metal-dependent hydrolase YbcI (DUF457 family)
MDPITHGITGALLGKAYFSKPQARVAVFAATLGAVFPDIDVFYEAYDEIVHRDPLAIVRYHRAITHSFVALPFFALLLAWLTHTIARRLGIACPSAKMLTVIYGVGIASHIVLDGMTSFGTRMWYPISQRRVAWDWVFIIDFTFTSLILAPQVIAWIYRDTQRSREKCVPHALGMWTLFTLGIAIAWWLAYEVGMPFHFWIVGVASALFAAAFFLPGRGGWGFRVKSSAWCQAGTYVTIAYLLACGMAHHVAMQRVKNFAATNHIAVDRIGALPIPPSLLDWGDAIRTPDGVYQSQFDLRQSQPAPFRFVADSPADTFTTRALEEPDVQLYLTFARFPSIQTSVENGEHLVEFGEDRFVNGRRGAKSPFTYLVVFDAAGNLIEQGFQTNAMSLREIIRRPPKPPAGAP